ncbi:hypothetical protein [Pantoea sp. GM01]|uniref:hypothetical protein n=1 Tax=Pantoea sp. GM01 TaxID=1144320 RepID=UPI000271165E|nr:hypothetical protein [Pantoea sp. GM01]EJL90344.1 hypothetical protein PMI17_01864 [Pantoea sp. GM01]
MEFHHKAWKEKALDLANQGISLGVINEKLASAFAWAAAAELAKAHLRDDEIYFWILGGYGAALVNCQRYHEAIEAAKEALDWEAKHDQILSRMTMARALYNMGAIDGAKTYFQQIYAMKSEDIYQAFPEIDRQTLTDLIELS